MTIELAQKDAPKAGPIPREILAWFKRKNLKPSMDYREVWQQEHSFAFTVAKLTEISLLDTVQKSLAKAIEEGTPMEVWRDNIEPMLEQSGWRENVSEAQKPHRLRIIYDTNMRTARANGQADRVKRTAKVLPYLKYELGPSKHHRPEHVAWAGLILPAEDDFWKEHFPPNDYGCKCRVRQIGRREADESGGPSEAPEDERVDYELPDGRTGTAPKGVHPSFAYPMGSDGREAALDDALKAAKKTKK